MKTTFAVKLMQEAFEAGWPEAYEDRYEDQMSGLWELHDGAPIRLLGRDGGEPEDNTLYRGWSWVVKELNALAARTA